MCGIVGGIELGRSTIEPSALRTAADSLRNRGPDDSGVWCDNIAHLGHRRLSILDPSSAGHQPMLSRNERYVIVHNGEIYNFQELRNRLAGSWASESDTEVILAAYEKWGPDCVTQFKGMFAFAIWDREQKRLFAARDRLGVKPFYYHIDGNRLLFGSRPRALFNLCPHLPRECDEQALRFYLESGYVPAPYSYYRSIRKLPPAHYLLFDGNGAVVSRYWDYAAIAVDRSWEGRDEEELLDELGELVSQSVALRMVSDVPIGAFLSGGIDSSLVVSMMAAQSSRPVKTFTIGFEEKAFDESEQALAISNHVGTEHHCEHLRVDDLLELLPTFSREFDEPFFDGSAIPTLAVSRMTRKSVVVSLSGDGGDELFGGYHYYRIARAMGRMYRLPAGIRKTLAAWLGVFPQHRIKLLSAALRKADPAAAFAFARSIQKDFATVLHPDVLSGTDSMEQLFEAAGRCFPGDLDTSELGMRLDTRYTLPDDYLQKVDVSSMAFSLESREPLLDHELVEWSMRLPLKWKLRSGRNKYLLCRLAYRYVPPSLLDHPKKGFEVPIGRWLRGPLREWAMERLQDPALFEAVPLNQKVALELFELHTSGARNVYPLVWAILMLLEFINTHEMNNQRLSYARA